MSVGFLGFSLVSGVVVWVGSAYLIGFGTGASNTVANLFVVEFSPRSEWSQRISWLQTLNASGSVLGMAAAGLLEPLVGMAVAALLAMPAIAIGGVGLPVPAGPFHFPHVLTGEELLRWCATAVRARRPCTSPLAPFTSSPPLQGSADRKTPFIYE
jgi:MFS family permease